MNSLIQCSHADFGYENQDAVVDVTMEVNPGDYICIVGENGSGKSTLMKGLLGLLKPTKGTISVSDELKKAGLVLAAADCGSEGFSGYRRRGRTVRLFKQAGKQAFLFRKGKEAGGKEYGTAGNRRTGKPVLPGLIRRTAKQRTLIARALCATDRLLILDEPITGLDPSAILEFYEIIRKLNRKEGVAILMVSHDIANVVKQAGKILHLKREVLFTERQRNI